MKYPVVCPDCNAERLISRSSYSEYKRGITTGRCRSCCNKAREYPDMRKPWKGAKETPEGLRLRNKFFNRIRPLVLERDGYTCVICSIQSEDLHVDHIKTWKDYPELRFNMDNCRTLCAPCHYYVTFKKKLPMGRVFSNKLKLTGEQI